MLSPTDSYGAGSTKESRDEGPSPGSAASLGYPSALECGAMMDEMSVPCWAITNNSLLQNGLPLISPGTRSLMWHSAISQVLLHTLKVCITFDRASKPELQETMES